MNEIQEKINEDNARIGSGLACLADWLKYNTESAWKNEKFHLLPQIVLSNNDYNYYQEVIKEARERLDEDVRYSGNWQTKEKLGL
jgi:hypothetical protein